MSSNIDQFRSQQRALDLWKGHRQRCRSELYYLCKFALSYDDVTPEVHKYLLATLQPFKGGRDTQINPTLQGCGYVPEVDMWNLEGNKRKNLILMSRGFLKTSVVTVGHVIQWLINYPDVRILLVSSKLQRAQEYLDVIKQHFVKNQQFRTLFPEFCPQPGPKGKMPDFGNADEFTLPCRKAILKEPSIRTCSAESAVAGGHYDVIICDDLVEEQYCRTADGIEYIKKFFGLLDPVLERKDGKQGWIYLIGTLYHHNDLHNVIYESEISKPKEQRVWQLYKQSAAPKYPDGPAAWESRLPLAALKAIERDPALGTQVLYNQYLLKIVSDSEGLLKDKSDIVWIEERHLAPLRAGFNYYVTIDLAGMEPAVKGDPDYTVLNLHGWGRDGRCYFEKIYHGRYDPHQVIDKMFWLFAEYPRIRSFKIEKEAHARVLMPFLRKEFPKRGTYLPIDPFPRDNKVSKQHKIRGTQPYWKEKAFVFSKDLDDTPEKSLETRMFLEKEILYFPKFNHDDILDTITDSLMTRDGRVVSEVQKGQAVFPADASHLHDGAVKTWKGIPVENVSVAEFYGQDERNSLLYDEMTGF